MSNYETRHMVADREFEHGREFLRVGQPFKATDVDAEWYRARHWASETRPPASAPTPVAVTKAKPEPLKEPAASPAAAEPKSVGRRVAPAAPPAAALTSTQTAGALVKPAAETPKPVAETKPASAETKPAPAETTKPVDETKPGGA